MFEDKSNEQSEFDRTKNLPVYKKGEEILKIAQRVAEDVRQRALDIADDEFMADSFENYASMILGDAAIICAKISGAETGDLYDLRMENAAIIRKAAREISTYCTGLKMFGFENTEYLEILRNEIEAFRPIFAEWVKTFDQWNYIIDRWGLFNPPGVNYDDDIPFDPNELF